MKLAIALVLFAASLSVCSAGINPSTASREFLRFVRKYNKSYSATEFQSRFENFRATLKRVEERNAYSSQIGGAQYGVTKFADMTVDEFRSTVLMRNPISLDQARMPGVPTLKPRVAVADLPTSFDWRPLGAVTAVKDQEQCGSCWAFSATETIESLQLVKQQHGFTNETLSLSPQQIVDCDTSDQGCNGGRTETAYDYVVSAGGIENITVYPYTGEDGQCEFQAADVAATIAGFKYATEADNEDTLRSNLVSWQPVSVCVDASKWQDYQSGVMTRAECAIVNVLDHCVQLVGYETNAPKPYYIVRNSWNTNWGIEGYIWLSIGEDTCGIAHDATVPTL